MSLSLGGSLAAGVANTAIGAGIGVASVVAGGRIPASIRCLDPAGPPGFVPFDFNPQSISMTRQAQINLRPSAGGAGGPGGSSGPAAQMVAPPMISIENILFEGVATKIRCDTLFHWQSPPSGLAAGALALMGVTQSNPPVVTFQWGPPMVGFMYDCMINTVTVAYKRFTPMGIPIRAMVSLRLQQVVSLLADFPTNPTSGGRSGRRTHVVKQGDTLQSIATTYYGRPQAWRPIAAVNGLKDPARVRPGTTVYLPNADELTERAS